MPREFANIKTTIWGDPTVRSLSLEHQGLYTQLWTHPDLSYAGVLDWRPGRNVAPLSAGSTAESIRALIPELEQKLFVIVDEDTEEILLRSYHRHDGLMKNPSLAVSSAKAYAAIGSNMLRGVIVHELTRLREESPEWKCWALAQVRDMLKHPAIDPKTLHLAPHGAPSPAPPFAPQGAPGVAPKRTATSTATSTNASHSVDGDRETESDDGPKRPATRLPKSWAPTAEHIAFAAERGIDIGHEVIAFREHATTHDRHAARWNSAFSTWLRNPRVAKTPVADSSAGMRVFGGPERIGLDE